MTPQAIARDIGNEALKSAPPVAVSGATLIHGLTVPDIAQIAVCAGTLIYLAMQGAYLWWKWQRDRNAAEKQAPTVPPPA